MFLLKRKKTAPSAPSVAFQRPQSRVLGGIRYSSDTARKYAVIPEEMAFFEALDVALHAAQKSTFYEVTRMANGALSVSSSKAYMGKIKLQGRKTWMQYMTSLYNSHTLEDASLEDYIQMLKYWAKSA